MMEMDPATEELSAKLAAELADSEREAMPDDLREELAGGERRKVDPRTMPARYSNLAAISRSPLHGLESFQFGGDDTLSRRIGSGTHAMLFGTPHIMWTGKDRRAKGYKPFAAEHADKLILTRKEWQRAEEISAAVRRHQVASNILFAPGTIRERTILWEQLGRARRTTPDVRGSYHVAELKSTRCSEPGKFTWDASKLGYHVQLADQVAAIEWETGKRPTEVYVIAVEQKRPYAVTVMQLSDRSIQKGAHLARVWLERLIECERTNLWPAYTDKVELLDVPDDGLDLVDYGDGDAEGDES